MSITWDERCDRDYAWTEAVNYYFTNGSHKFSDAMTMRCVEHEKYKLMTDNCWTVVKGQYPKP